MPDAARKQHGFSYWGEAAVCVVGYVGELARAVAADTASGQAGELYIEYLGITGIRIEPPTPSPVDVLLWF